MALTLLIQFVFRLSFGLALAMWLTPSKLVTGGFYRVHLWVLLGLSTLAALAAFFHPDRQSGDDSRIWNWVLAVAVAAGIASYTGAVIWLYEKSTVGKIALAVVACTTLAGAALATPWHKYISADRLSIEGLTLGILDLFAGGLLLGATFTAMLLGHWYLNTPTMKLLPLKRLVLLMGVAVVLRTILAAAGLSLELSHHALGTATMWFVVLLWASGLVCTLVLAIMTWETLKIPNTQSATGILYVGMVCCFLGELTSQLLSVETLYPV
jgi:hypothetical protein